ncbi:hypothetical protein CISIN_1g0387752mg, partial [Citrus sinensis]
KPLQPNVALMTFFKRVEVHSIFPLFEGALEIGRVTKHLFRNWAKITSTLVMVIIIVVSLLVMKLATTQVVFSVLTQLVLVGWLFPNAFLLTKTKSNFCRPEMSDSINLTVDISTSMQTIIALKKAVQINTTTRFPSIFEFSSYSTPTAFIIHCILRANHCNPKHSVTVKERAELNKIRMRLGVQHTINHQTCAERSIRTSELILELKKIFENLGIKCHLPPQEIHITQLNLNNWTMPSHSLRQGKSLAVLLAVLLKSIFNQSQILKSMIENQSACLHTTSLKSLPWDSAYIIPSSEEINLRPPPKPLKIGNYLITIKKKHL